MNAALELETDVARYDATDEDPTDTTFTFSLAGADKDLFNLRDTTAAEEESPNATPSRQPPDRFSSSRRSLTTRTRRTRTRTTYTR